MLNPMELSDPKCLESDSATFYMVVPHDPEQPCLGPFRIQDHAWYEHMQSYIKNDLGLEEHEYDLRVTIDVGNDFFHHKIVVEGSLCQ